MQMEQAYIMSWLELLIALTIENQSISSMSSISSFSHSSPPAGETISKWGYSFKWTDSHLAQEIIKPLRQEYDTLGAAALERIQAVRAALLEESKARGTSPPPNDLYILLRDHRGEDETLTQFWDELHTVPDWVDWKQLERGQRFFYRYAIANIVGFALQGFMAENSVRLFLCRCHVPCNSHDN
jgi:hypothetical protein